MQKPDTEEPWTCTADMGGRVRIPRPHTVQGSAALYTEVWLDGLLSVNRNGRKKLRGHGCWKAGIKTIWDSSVPRAIEKTKF